MLSSETMLKMRCLPTLPVEHANPRTALYFKKEIKLVVLAGMGGVRSW